MALAAHHAGVVERIHSSLKSCRAGRLMRVRVPPPVLDGHWGNLADPPASGAGDFLVRGQGGQQ